MRYTETSVLDYFKYTKPSYLILHVMGEIRFYNKYKSLPSIPLYGIRSILKRTITRIKVPISNHVGPSGQRPRAGILG